MSLIFSSIMLDGITPQTYLISLFVALACGIVTAIASAHSSHASKSFLVSLALLPMIVDTVIIMVNGNIGTGVAVMGAFSLVRFRSVPGKAKDIVSIFLAMTAGLTCAAGYVGLAVLFCILVSAIMLILSCIPMGEEGMMDLHITVPESLNFANEFDDIFDEYTNKYRLVRTKTSNMGSLYKLYYKVELKNKNQMKNFVDTLRCRNGNLEISIAEPDENMGEL